VEKTFPLGVLCDRTKDARQHSAPAPAPPLESLPALLDIPEQDAEADTSIAAAGEVDLQVRVAGFGGQGVLLLGEILAEAGLDAGLEVSWLPSYGPEMRSGTSNCHVRLSNEPIDSPMVASPNVLIAMNEPSLRKFIGTVRPGGWILYNGNAIPEDCARADARDLSIPFTHVADEIGDARITNMVMLGALLEITGALSQASVDSALRRLVKSARWLELDKRALERGSLLYRDSLAAI
jgi:Pyruvate/2-oxoacid:ferredoxin oxidoreductase gamma subunit